MKANLHQRTFTWLCWSSLSGLTGPTPPPCRAGSLKNTKGRTRRQGDAETRGLLARVQSCEEPVSLRPTSRVSPSLPRVRFFGPRVRPPEGISVESSILRAIDPVAQNVPASPRPRVPVSASPAVVRVHLVTENVTRELSLEDYVLGVVAAEGSMEDQPEALKALAIAARTYAVKNAGRHARDGFDFCTTTHCQRFIPADNRSALRAPIVDAVKQTEGEVMRDEAGRLVDSYFSASCGGVTANMQTLWGANAPAYLRGVRDEFCATMPHHNWTDVISSERLLLALRSDQRTDPGARLKELLVTRRDATGRAELITIDGERRRTVSGWDFKIIVGRKLGWNLLKSSRFEDRAFRIEFHLSRQRLWPRFGSLSGRRACNGATRCELPANSGEVLSGNECIAGSRRSSRGFAAAQCGKALPYRSIALISSRGYALATKGTASNSSARIPERHSLSALCGGRAAQASDSHGFVADLIWNDGTVVTNARPTTTKRTTLSSEHFRVSYPLSLPQREAEGILKTLEATRANLLQRITAAGFPLSQIPATEIFINATTGDFVGRTGQAWWAAAATKGNHIELQPVEVLKRRKVLDTTLRHELVHILIDKLSRGRAPRWLAEGMALYFAGEGPLVARYGSKGKIDVNEIDDRLSKASSADEMRRAYAAAYGAVSGIVKSNGEASLWRRIASP